VTVPARSRCTSVWAQYTIRSRLRPRRLRGRLKAQGIPTAIYYPKSMHQQTAYRHFRSPTAACRQRKAFG
jgi:dTDP-4-amino-4,6-dideoxygalactose transaminase